MRQLYRLADALLLPSREEGFGIPILEAALARIPVFCSDIPPLVELGKDAVFYFAPDADPAAVAERISSVLDADQTHASAQARCSRAQLGSHLRKTSSANVERASSMNRRYSTRLFRKILVPIVQGAPTETAIKVAMLIADVSNIVLVGIVAIPDEETLSAAALPARRLRETLHGLTEVFGLKAIGRARVSHRPWTEVLQVVDEEVPDLLVVSDDQLLQLQTTAGEALQNPLCDMILAWGPVPDKPADVLFVLRGRAQC